MVPAGIATQVNLSVFIQRYAPHTLAATRCIGSVHSVYFYSQTRRSNVNLICLYLALTCNSEKKGMPNRILCCSIQGRFHSGSGSSGLILLLSRVNQHLLR